MASAQLKRCHSPGADSDITLVSSGSDELSSDCRSSVGDFPSSGDESSGEATSPPERKRMATTGTGTSSSSSSVPKQTAAADIIWRNKDCSPLRFDFSGRPGLTVYFDESSTPMEVFNEYLTEEFFQKVADQTNKYADEYNRNGPVQRASHSRMWSNTNPGEMKAMVCLVILMGIAPKPDLRSYWTRHPVIDTPFFAKTMPRDRFLQLLKYLHFNDDDDDDGSDLLFKLRPVIDSVTERFKTVYIPSQNIATDESLWKFYGRRKCKFDYYDPSQRDRFGIKVYKTCQSTGEAAGYTWNIKIVTGEARGAVSASSRVALLLDLNKELLDCGYNMFLDDSFASPELLLQLRHRATNVCGTIKLDRRHMPADLKDVKLRSGERAFRSSDSGLLALVWQDKKNIKMLSTMHSASMEPTERRDKHGIPVEKPSCVIEYNRGRCGAGISDQLALCHGCVTKKVKWYKKLFFYLVDLCLSNAFILYKVLGHETTYTDFRLNLISELLQDVILREYSARGRPHTLPDSSRLTGRHFPMGLPPTQRNARPCKRCVVCKANGQRRETRYACDTCNIALCVDPCFKAYHTQKNY